MQTSHRGFFADGHAQFVDYSVKQTLMDIESLESGKRATTDKPAENAIKWYRLLAGKGDSVQFRLGCAATVQLFAPSGEELLSASANKVMNWFGCHVPENGTYYLALHDVTTANVTTVGVDYNLIVGDRPHGDVNGDDAVNVADIAAVIDVMAGSGTYGGVPHWADVNGDGNVDVADIAAVIDIMAGK